MNNKGILFIGAGFVAGLSLLSGCISSPENGRWSERNQEVLEARAADAEKVLDSTPDWYIKPPRDTGALFGVGTASASDLQFALDKARLRASAQIAEQYGQLLSANRVSAIQDSSVGGQITGGDEQVIDSLTSEVDLTGLIVEEAKIIQDKIGFRAYVLAALPLGDANLVQTQKRLNNQVKKGIAVVDEQQVKLLDRVEKKKLQAQ